MGTVLNDLGVFQRIIKKFSISCLSNASPVPLTARKPEPHRNHLCWTWAALPTLLLLLLPAKLQHKAAGWTFWNSPGSGHPLVVLHWGHTLFSAQGCSIPVFSKASLQATQALLWTVIGLTHSQDAAERKSQKSTVWALLQLFWGIPTCKPKCVRSEQAWRADLVHKEKYNENSVSNSAYFNSLERSFHSCTRLPLFFNIGQDILSDYSSLKLNLYSWLFLNGTYFCMARREIKEENYPKMFLSI